MPFAAWYGPAGIVPSNSLSAGAVRSPIPLAIWEEKRVQLPNSCCVIAASVPPKSGPGPRPAGPRSLPASASAPIMTQKRLAVAASFGVRAVSCCQPPPLQVAFLPNPTLPAEPALLACLYQLSQPHHRRGQLTASPVNLPSPPHTQKLSSSQQDKSLKADIGQFESSLPPRDRGTTRSASAVVSSLPISAISGLSTWGCTPAGTAAPSSRRSFDTRLFLPRCIPVLTHNNIHTTISRSSIRTSRHRLGDRQKQHVRGCRVSLSPTPSPSTNTATTNPPLFLLLLPNPRVRVFADAALSAKSGAWTRSWTASRLLT